MSNWAVTNNDRKPATRAGYFLAVLTAGYAFNQIDRQILGILIEPIKAEFTLSDTQMGLLSGIFTFAYIAIGIPIAAFADRSTRRNLLAWCLGAWSGLTALCGLATSFMQLLFLRLAVGAGESGGNPISLSIISDLYPPEKRAGAIGIYGLGTNIGTLISLVIGGVVAANVGWRAAFFIVGLPGLLLALLLYTTTREPKRGQSEQRIVSDRAASLVSTLKQIFIIPSLRNLVLALAAFVIPYASLLVWLPSFFVRSHDMDLGDVGLRLGLVIGILGAIGSVSGGYLADWIRRKRQRYVPVYLGLSYVCCAPFAVLALQADHSTTAMLFLAGWTVSSSLGTGAQFALIQGLVGVRMRATVMAAIGIVMNVFAFYIGPQVIGLISDYIAPDRGSESLRHALLIVCSFYGIAMILTILMARTIHHDTENALLLP